TLANHNGGVVGGMTTGMPVILRTAFKPTASIGQPQRTVDLYQKTAATIEIAGRHDPAIVHRAVHVVNAAVYYGILDLMLAERPREWML
ncbi:MAG: chorismate synthase, partial [bacterium]